MKTRPPVWLLLSFLVYLTLSWAAPAAGRLFPPCQAINYSLVSNNTGINYGYTDPTTAVYMEETHYVVDVQSGGERLIILPDQHLDQGILTWIDRYRNLGEAYYHYSVHYVIYDPGLGGWKAGGWSFPTSSYNPSLEQLQVKDGVVAWIAHWRLGPNPTDKQEHQVICATYDPKLSTWAKWNGDWQKDWYDGTGPENLKLKNGVVAWPMRGKGGEANEENPVNVLQVIYDQELSQWQSYSGWYCGTGMGFDWIEIMDDITMIHIRISQGFPFYIKFDWFPQYDAFNHKWTEPGEGDVDPAIRRAYFVAAPSSADLSQPTTGVVPFLVWFWDCSYALDGVSSPSIYSWGLAPGVTSSDRSPFYTYTSPGTYNTYLNVFHTSGSYPATGQIIAQAPIPPPLPSPPPPPTPFGGISINNGAAYTNSANVTLNLSYEDRSKQMCFRQTPGRLQYTDWEPVADSKAWTLSTLHELGTSPDGPHTVYVKFKNLLGDESEVYSATITLVTTPPDAWLWLDYGAPSTTNRNVQVLSLAASNYPLQMSYAACEIAKNGIVWGVWWTPWADYPSWLPLYAVVPFSSLSWQKPVLVGLVRFKDAAGNITQVQQNITLMPPPLGHLPLLLGD